jgi:hypothetical protein
MIQVKITNYSLFNDKFEISAVKIKKYLSVIRTLNECIWSIAFPPYTTASMSDTVLIPSGNALHYVSVVYIYHTQYNS